MSRRCSANTGTRWCFIISFQYSLWHTLWTLSPHSVLRSLPPFMTPSLKHPYNIPLWWSGDLGRAPCLFLFCDSYTDPRHKNTVALTGACAGAPLWLINPHQYTLPINTPTLCIRTLSLSQVTTRSINTPSYRYIPSTHTVGLPVLKIKINKHILVTSLSLSTYPLNPSSSSQTTLSARSHSLYRRSVCYKAIWPLHKDKGQEKTPPTSGRKPMRTKLMTPH